MRRWWWIFASAALGCAPSPSRVLIDETFRESATRHHGPAQTRGANTAVREPDLSAPVSRSIVVSLAVARDPALAAHAHRVRAMLHSARAEGALPPPALSAQVWNLPLLAPYALGEADMYMVEIRQTFPAAGSLDARARAMAEEARATAAELASHEREVARRAEEAYADYARAVARQAAFDAQIALLEEMFDAVRARFPSSSDALAEMTRIETEAARVRRARTRAEGEVARARTVINALLLRRPDAPLGPPRDFEPDTIRLGLDELLARAAHSRGSIAAARARLRAARARSDAARAEATWPEFMVSGGYWQAPEMRPGIGAGFSMTLPWLGSGPRARMDEAREREAAEAASVREADAIVRQEVSEALARLVALEREWRVLRNEEAPAAERAVDAVRAAYVSGRSDLLAWIDAARAVLDVRTEEADVSADLSRAMAALEWAVGEGLPRVRVTSAGEAGP